MARNLIPRDSSPVAELVEWSDTECRAVAAVISDELHPRLWAARLTLERRLREADGDIEQRGLLSGRITALNEAVNDLRSAEAILNVVDAPVSWEALEQPGA